MAGKIYFPNIAYHYCPIRDGWGKISSAALDYCRKGIRGLARGECC